MNKRMYRMYAHMRVFLEKSKDDSLFGGEFSALGASPSLLEDVFKKWEKVVARLDEKNPEYSLRYETEIKIQRSFNAAQLDFIGAQIEDWHLQWKNRIMIDNEDENNVSKTRLDIAKNHLRVMICGD